MTAKEYIERPTKVSAIIYDGFNKEELETFARGSIVISIKDGKPLLSNPEGLTPVEFGDYVVKGPDGNFYSCNKKGFDSFFIEVTE